MHAVMAVAREAKAWRTVQLGPPLPAAAKGLVKPGPPLPVAAEGLVKPGPPLPAATEGLVKPGPPLPAATEGIMKPGPPLLRVNRRILVFLLRRGWSGFRAAPEKAWQGVVWVSRSARRGRVVRRYAAGTQGELSRPKLLIGVTGRSWEGACCIRVDGDVRETRETRSHAVNPYPRPLGAGKATFRQTLNRCDAPTPLGVAGVRCKPRVPGSTPRERERLSSRSRANGNQDLCHYLIHVA